jgi:hydrogenase maturation protease
MCLRSSKRIVVAGIGNTIAGDDGAGIETVKLLKKRIPPDPRLSFVLLEGDLFEISDYLDTADLILFVDAVAGSPAGRIITGREMPRAFVPSFHQTDVGAVMGCLKSLDYADPFPEWEVWGITADPPREVSTSLTPLVKQAVLELADSLAVKIKEMLALT